MRKRRKKMFYALFGLAFGFLIPYMARRFAKFMPATPGYALYRLVWPVKRVSRQKRSGSAAYCRLARRYLMRSVGWAIIASALTYTVYEVFAENAVWYASLVWLLLLLYEIDERMQLLPDILTVPLLILGFMFAAGQGCGAADYAVTPAVLSAAGAAAGYVLPVLASLFLVKKYPDAFGGGDIKLLAAAGAWLGLGAVPYLILLSSVIFAFFMLARRQRAGAFGPSVVIAVLVLVFFNACNF